jgi:hypothetical protein
MDGQNIKDRRLMKVVNTIKLPEFISLKALLNSETEEDVNIGLENMKNLDLDPLYILLLAKQCSIYTRNRILEKFDSYIFEDPKFLDYKREVTRYWGDNSVVVDISWENLYKTITVYYNDDENAKKIFTIMFDSEIQVAIKNVIDYSFVDTINIKVKW